MEAERAEILKFMRDFKAALKNSPVDEHEFLKCLRRGKSLLPDVKVVDAKLEVQWDGNMKNLKLLFMEFHYSSFLRILMDNMSVELVQMIPKGSVASVLDVFFLCGNHSDALLVLSGALQTCRSGYKANKCTALLEKFLLEHSLAVMFQIECQTAAKSKSFSRCKVQHDTWNEIITAVVSLPDKMANLHGKDTGQIFHPEKYVNFVTSEIHTVLHKLFLKANSGQDVSVEFLSNLLGKLCILGFGETVWNQLLPVILESVSNPLWCRICERLVTRVPDRYLESVVVPIVKLVPWYGYMSKLLGNSVTENHKMEFLLSNKLLLLRYFQQNSILQNIIGYLQSSECRKPLYHKVMMTLLDVWGNGSSVKHTSYEQQQYITRAILVCLAFMDNAYKQQHQNEMLTKLMAGMQVHLDSPLPTVRRLGMVLAEQLSQAVDTTGHKLEFEYDHDSEVEELVSLTKIPVEPDVEDLTRKIPQKVRIEADDCDGSDRSATEARKANLEDQDSELDSDDDFVPYDTSHDTEVSKVKAPVYLRECMEGLISQDDPDRVDACLAAAEQLVRTHQYMASEVAVEFTKILLHLQDNVATPGFSPLRFGAMVALLVTEPKQVAEYLAKEFYERNYNLRQRLDMLEVLGAGAQELSQPKEKAKNLPKLKPEIRKSETSHDPSEDFHWREVVQRRIESKTRRFGKGRSKSEATPVQSKFAPVAGSFFFPLLSNFDRKEATFDLLGDDHMVLQKLLYTLGIITYSALHAPITIKMCSALLEFTWMLRYHSQPGVRQGLLFSLSMVFLAVPSHALYTDLQTEVAEVKDWLEDVVKKDTDKECCSMAVQTLVLLENCLKKALSLETQS